MASILESGNVRLSPEELISYRAAADRLHESCQMAIDLKMPITVEEWLLLRLADGALKGNLRDIDSVIGRIEREIQLRRRQ